MSFGISVWEITPVLLTTCKSSPPPETPSQMIRNTSVLDALFSGMHKRSCPISIRHTFTSTNHLTGKLLCFHSPKHVISVLNHCYKLLSKPLKVHTHTIIWKLLIFLTEMKYCYLSCSIYLRRLNFLFISSFNQRANVKPSNSYLPPNSRQQYEFYNNVFIS